VLNSENEKLAIKEIRNSIVIDSLLSSYARCGVCKLAPLKGVFAKNERGYRLKAKKSF